MRERAHICAHIGLYVYAAAVVLLQKQICGCAFVFRLLRVFVCGIVYLFNVCVHVCACTRARKCVSQMHFYVCVCVFVCVLLVVVAKKVWLLTNTHIPGRVCECECV